MRTFDPAELPHQRVHQLLLVGVAPRPIAFVGSVDAEGNAWLSDERGGGEPRVGVPEQIWHQVRHQLIATFGWGVILSADITLKGTMICGENLKLVISEAEEIWVREIESNS